MGITLHVEGIDPKFIGNIAGQQTLSSLACIFLDASEDRIANPPIRLKRDCPFGAITKVQAELNGLAAHVDLAHSNEVTHIQSDDVELFVARNGQKAFLQIVPASRETPIESLKTWLFGPALILALARHSVYCLHASSIEIDGRAYMLIGRSGAGKSTLARAANRPLTDDVSPIGGAELLPHFPQLKLAVGCYPNLAERYPLGGYIHVTRAQSGVGNLSAIDAPSLLRLLLSHTIAARLFHADELAPHLRWCAAMAEQFAKRSAVLSLSHQPSSPHAAALSALESLGEFARISG